MERCPREGCGGSVFEIEGVKKCFSCSREVGKVGSEPEPDKKSEEKEEVEMAEKPMCKRHPETPAKIGKNGHSTGLCIECLVDRVRKRNSASPGKKRGRKISGEVERKAPAEKKESGGGKERAKAINLFCMRCGFHMELPDPARFADKGE